MGCEYMAESIMLDIPTDWLRLPATCHHNDSELMALANTFVETKVSDEKWIQPPMLFYLWGHSYEFERNNNWEIIEEFSEYVGNREDVWYATNGEIYEYVKAFDSLIFGAEGKLIKNPSAIDVYINYYGHLYVVPAGKTIEADPFERN